jgi:hypothetical protein
MASSGVTVATHDREVHVYRITGEEIDQLCEIGYLKAVDLGSFTLCVGILVSLLITLRTVAIADPATHADFVASAVVVGVLTAVFGIRVVLASRHAKQAVEKLKAAS